MRFGGDEVAACLGAEDAMDEIRSVSVRHFLLLLMMLGLAASRFGFADHKYVAEFRKGERFLVTDEGGDVESA
jgi:hypothetical protein